jgi:hypothetical protein
MNRSRSSDGSLEFCARQTVLAARGQDFLPGTVMASISYFGQHSKPIPLPFTTFCTSDLFRTTKKFPQFSPCEYLQIC